jgi:hypothetical protein
MSLSNPLNVSFYLKFSLNISFYPRLVLDVYPSQQRRPNRIGYRDFINLVLLGQ